MAERTTGARRGSTGPARATTTTPGGRTTGKTPKAPRPVWQRRLLTGLKVAAIAVLVIALLGMGGLAIAYQRTNLPDPNASFLTNKSNVYYRDGTTVIGSFADQNRTSISYADMPQTIRDAVVAAENRSFWTDKGISPTGIARAVYGILRGTSALGGGSTITQEYIKILYLTSDQTASRKAKEVLLAIKMGRSMPKEQILQGYLNTIYFGRGAYGIQAAAKAYFNVDAKALNLQQSVALAAILNNPSLFDPADGEKNVARLTNRYAYVLDGMVQMGTVTQAQADAAKNLPVFPDVPKSSRYGGPKGFLLKMVEAELTADGFDPATISGGGLQITTTFDEKAQAAAVASAQKYTDAAATGAKTKQDPAQLHAAIASVAVGTGEVLALYGGPDYLASSRNWATTDRPAASTFKAYAVVAGLRNGFSLRSTLNGNTFTPKGDSSTIRNEFNTQYGPVSLVKATADSINTAFVDLTQQIPNGPAQVIKAANDAGVTTGAGWDANNRIALGTAEVSPLDQATGYATLANGGTYVPSHLVKEVKDSTGKVLYTAKPQGQQNIDPKIATDTTYALENVVNEGTGAKVSSLGRDIAGKTGTADVNGHVVSSWFIGYTKQVSTAVMYVAGDGGNGNLDVYAKRGDATFFGGTYPALTWLDYMKVATDGMPKLTFDPPVYVNATATPSPVPSATPSDTPTPSAPPPSSAPPPPPPSSTQPTPTQTASTKPSSSQSPAGGKPSASVS
ncbi:MAG TPA: transglycosylase domain-containing protein [Propionibacteriaceae bacterium]|nr:transglycosylase domain-containing protein [Propionibacteriaceae bacterium]